MTLLANIDGLALAEMGPTQRSLVLKELGEALIEALRARGGKSSKRELIDDVVQSTQREYPEVHSALTYQEALGRLVIDDLDGDVLANSAH